MADVIAENAYRKATTINIFLRPIRSLKRQQLTWQSLLKMKEN